MAGRGTLGFVAGRASTRRSAVAALLVSVLVICTLVTTLITAMGPLTQSALDASTAALPVDDTVVEVRTSYDDDDPQAQDAAVRAALAPVNDPLGGDIVSRAEGVTYDVVDNRRAAQPFAFSALAGADDRLELAAGRMPQPTSPQRSALEVAVAQEVAERFDLAPGDRLRLRSRYDESVVSPTVVGIWLPPDPDQRRWLDGLIGSDPDDAAPASADEAGRQWPPLLTTQGAFRQVAGPVPSITWRAVPDLARAEPEDLPELAKAAAGAQDDLEAAEAETGSSLQISNPLPDVVEGQQRAVAVFRSLILVPAVLLLILGLVGLTMVARLLAGSREGEETLLRSRGGSPWQLVRPTLLEAVGCGLLGAVAGPIVAAFAGPVDGLDDLGVTGWVTGAAAAAACTVALVLPSAVRALSQRGERSDPSPKERRRRVAGLAFGLILVVALGLTAVTQLLRYETVGSASSGTSVDPLLVGSPGLVLVSGCVLLTLAAIPLARLLTSASSGLRGLTGPLSTRSVARAAGSAIPLMLVVASGTGIVWFASFQETSQRDAREARATYAVGADLRAQVSQSSTDGSLETVRDLRSVTGVAGVMPVRSESVTVDREPVDVVMADLSATSGTALDPAVFDSAPSRAAKRQLVDRSWATSGDAVEIPAGTQDAVLRFDNPGAVVSGTALLAAADGTVSSTVMDSDGRRARLHWPEGLPGTHRLVGLEVTAELPECAAGTARTARIGLDTVRVAGQTFSPNLEWSSGADGPADRIEHDCSTGRTAHSNAVVVASPDDGSAPPAAITRGLAQTIGVDPGDEVRFSLGSSTLDVSVAAVLPVIPGVEDGNEGVLLDHSTAAGVLLRSGRSIAPTSWWIDIRPGADSASVADAVRAQLGAGTPVSTREQMLDELDDDPGTGGAGLAASLRWTALGGGAVCLLLLSAAALLRRGDRARQAGVLRALGAGQRSVVGVIGGEYVLTVGLGAVVGAVVGTGVAALVLPVVTLGPGGVALIPSPVLSAPWLVVLLSTAALLLAPLTLVLSLARADARAAMVTDLRTLEHG